MKPARMTQHPFVDRPDRRQRFATHQAQKPDFECVEFSRICAKAGAQCLLTALWRSNSRTVSNG